MGIQTSINDRPIKSGKRRFTATVKDPALAQSMSGTFDSRDEAKKFFATAIPQFIALTQAAPAPAPAPPTPQETFDNQTGAELCDMYSAGPAKPYEIPLLQMLRPHLEKATLGDMDELWVESLCARMLRSDTKRGTTYKGLTIKYCLLAFARAWVWRRRHLRLTTQFIFPFMSKQHLGSKLDSGRKRVMGPDEESTLMERCAKGKIKQARHMALLIQLALETGARLQELVLAETAEFDLDARIWVIPEEHTKMKVERHVILTRKAVEIVAELRGLMENKSRRLFGAMGTAKNVGNRFSRLTDRLGIVDLTFHDLRHTAITNMVKKFRKLKVEEIMAMVGHATYAMHLRYSHIRVDELVHLME